MLLSRSTPCPRRRGLAKGVLAGLLLTLLEEQGRQPEDIFAYVVHDNAASCALLEALGHQRGALFHWTGYERAA